MNQFIPSRNMARIIRKNNDLTRRISSPEPTNAHYRLFKSYVTKRHDDGQMARMDQRDFSSMINNSPIETVLISYYDSAEMLVGAVLADLQSDGLSAVYSFFDVAQGERSLGTFMVIDMMDIAKDLSLTWLYLGYYVAESRKMAYKARFGPAEIFKDGFWQAANGALTASA